MTVVFLLPCKTPDSDRPVPALTIDATMGAIERRACFFRKTSFNQTAFFAENAWVSSDHMASTAEKSRLIQSDSFITCEWEPIDSLNPSTD
jgi:hypothetical protein